MLVIYMCVQKYAERGGTEFFFVVNIQVSGFNVSSHSHHN